jgi:hypothetical protein
MSADVVEDEPTVRKFLTLLHSRAAAALSHERRPGVVQLVSIAPNDSGMSVSPFEAGDVDHMVEAALVDARAGRNVYVETRTVRPGRPNERGRGKIESTIASFAFVIDRDNDTGKAGHINRNDTVVVETSPGNFHEWLFLDRALSATEAKALGEHIRKATGADHDTGVITQPYRVPGTPNYPGAKKRARGRIVVPTRLIRVSDKVWTPGEIQVVFSVDEAQAAKLARAREPAGALNRNGPIHSTPRRSGAVKRKVAATATVEMDRSAQFQSAVNAAVRSGMAPDQLEVLMRAHPDGCASKYLEGGDRLRQEIDRSWRKVGDDRHAGGDLDHHDDHGGDRLHGLHDHDAGLGGAELLDRVYEFLGRFIVYPSRDAHAGHVLWIAHTHLMDCWETTPRLAFLSPEPASGKTRALEITELLVPRPTPAINVSPAYLVRKVAAEEGLPTVLFDEIDAVFGPKAREGNEDVRALLNAGYRRGATVGRCVMHGSAAIPEELPAFCAVALAGPGELPDTVLSRSIIIRMRRRAPNEAVRPYRRREHAREGELLRDRLGAWAVAAISRIAVPDMPPQVADRDADCWEPMIATAEAAGGHWPETARCCAVALVELLRGDGEERLSIRLLSDMQTVLGNDEQAPTSAILDKLHKLDESPWADIRGKPLNDRGLAVRLRPYGIKPCVIRVGSTTPRGYRREDFVDAWARYLPPLP